MKLNRVTTASCFLILTFWLLSCTEEDAPVADEQLRVKSLRLTSDISDDEKYSQVSYESNRIIITSENIEDGISDREEQEFSFNGKGDIEYYTYHAENYCPDTAFYDYSDPQKIVKSWHIYNEGAPCEFWDTQETTFTLNVDGTLKFKSYSPTVTAYETIDGNIVARYDTIDNFKKVGDYIFNHSVEVPENFELIYMLYFSTDYWIDKNLVVEKLDIENNDFRRIKNDFVFDEKGNITQVVRYLSYEQIPDYRLWYTMDIEYETYD